MKADFISCPRLYVRREIKPAQNKQTNQDQINERNKNKK
jgi:hypothetical protein